MATPTTVHVKMQLRLDTAANWASVNPTLLNGEMGLESDTQKIKIGDGSTAWNSLSYFPFLAGGGIVNGNLEIGSTGTLTFEGATVNGFETQLAVTNPTADRTITLPDVSGTVVTTGDTGSVTSTMLADGTIVNADINTSAAIDHSKLATMTAGYVLVGNASNVPTATQITGDVTISDSGVTAIGSGVIVDADIAAGAEIAVSKLANGTVNQVLVTDGTDVSWSDDLTLAGNLTVNGTTTTINTQDLLVEDKNIIIGNVDPPTDVTADGGGITLKGATNKTINWVDATDAWTSSERFSVPLGTESAPSLTFTGDPDTGIYSPGANQVAISTSETERVEFGASEVVFNDGGENYDFRIEGDTEANLLFVDASTNRVGLGISGPLKKAEIRSTPETADTDGLRVGDGIRYLEFAQTGATYNYMQVGSNQNLIYFSGSDLHVSTDGANAITLNTNSLERVRVTSDGRVGVGTTNVDELIHVESDGATPKIKVESTLANSSPGFRVTNDARTYDIRIDGTNDNLQFYDATASQGRVAIDSSGRLLVGTASAQTIGNSQAQLEVSTDSSTGYALSLSRSFTDIYGPQINFRSTRGTAASPVIVDDDDQLGSIAFYGYDGADSNNQFASISVFVDGTPGNNICPGRLVFSVTADGASSPTTSPSAMTINSGQEVLIGYSADNGAYKLQVNSQIFATSATIATSDGRYKENVVTLDGCVDLVKALRPVSFDWKHQEPITRIDEEGETVVVREAHNFPDGTQVGFIAQEVETVLADKPWLGSVIKQNVRPAVTDADGNELAPEEEFLGIAEGNLVAVLTSALKEAIGEIESLKARVAVLEAS